MHVLSQVGTSFGRSAPFVLRLPVWPLLELVGEAASPPIISCCVQHGWHLSVCGIDFFYRVYRPTPCPFGKISRPPLQFSVSNVFGGGSKVVGELDVSFCASWLVCPV